MSRCVRVRMKCMQRWGLYGVVWCHVMATLQGVPARPAVTGPR